MKRLVNWNSRESALKYHRDHNRSDWVLDYKVDMSLSYGNFLHFDSDADVELFKEQYDVRVV